MRQTIEEETLRAMDLTQDEFVSGLFEIKCDITEGKEPVAHPHCLIVGGVPASGKTKVLESFAGKNYVLIDTDSLRTYHPKFKEWRKLKEMPFLTNAAAREWFAWTVDSMRNNTIVDGEKLKYNTIIETSFKSDWAEQIDKFKEKGFTVEIKALAVPIDQIALSVHKRYEEEILQYGNGRYIEYDSIKTYNDALPAALETTIKKGAADKCEIHGRRGLVAVVTPESAIRAIIANERIHKKSPDEYEKMTKEWIAVTKLMSIRNASDEEFNQLCKFIDKTIGIMEKEGYTQDNIEYLKNISLNIKTRETGAVLDYLPEVLDGYKDIDQQSGNVVEYPIKEKRQNIKVGDVVSFHCEHPAMDKQKVAYGTVVHIEGSEITIDSPLGYYNRDINSITLATEGDLHNFKSKVRQSAQAIVEKAKEQTNKVEILGTPKKTDIPQITNFQNDTKSIHI